MSESKLDSILKNLHSNTDDTGVGEVGAIKQQDTGRPKKYPKNKKEAIALLKQTRTAKGKTSATVDDNYSAASAWQEIVKDAELKYLLTEEFFTAVESGDLSIVAKYYLHGFPKNHKDYRTGMTALHFAAAARARDVIRFLLREGKCNFLARDNEGRLASELAYIHGNDPAVARLLSIKERKQAKARGVVLTYRPVSKKKIL